MISAISRTSHKAIVAIPPTVLTNLSARAATPVNTKPPEAYRRSYSLKSLSSHTSNNHLAGGQHENRLACHTL